MPAPQAQVLYSSTPVWSAVFAALLVNGERMRAVGWVGGAIILVASVIAASGGGDGLRHGGRGAVERSWQLNAG